MSSSIGSNIPYDSNILKREVNADSTNSVHSLDSSEEGGKTNVKTLKFLNSYESDISNEDINELHHTAGNHFILTDSSAFGFYKLYINNEGQLEIIDNIEIKDLGNILEGKVPLDPNFQRNIEQLDHALKKYKPVFRGKEIQKGTIRPGEILMLSEKIKESDFIELELTNRNEKTLKKILWTGINFFKKEGVYEIEHQAGNKNIKEIFEVVKDNRGIARIFSKNIEPLLIGSGVYRSAILQFEESSGKGVVKKIITDEEKSDIIAPRMTNELQIVQELWKSDQNNAKLDKNNLYIQEPPHFYRTENDEVILSNERLYLGDADNLDEILKSDFNVSESNVHKAGLMKLKFGFRMLEGVSYIHSKGIIHADVKLSNTWVDRNKNGSVIPRIGDFDGSLTQAGILNVFKSIDLTLLEPEHDPEKQAKKDVFLLINFARACTEPFFCQSDALNFINFAKSRSGEIDQLKEDIKRIDKKKIDYPKFIENHKILREFVDLHQKKDMFALGASLFLMFVGNTPGFRNQQSINPFEKMANVTKENRSQIEKELTIGIGQKLGYLPSDNPSQNDMNMDKESLDIIKPYIDSIMGLLEADPKERKMIKPANDPLHLFDDIF